jgi:hypothetical protein
MHYTDRFRMRLTIRVVFYAGICLLGFIDGRKEWEKKYGRFCYEIMTFMESLENESGSEEGST